MPAPATSGAVMTRPTSAIQATTEAGGIMRVEREEHRVEPAQAAAAPRPPRIAIIDGSGPGLQALARVRVEQVNVPRVEPELRRLALPDRARGVQASDH